MRKVLLEAAGEEVEVVLERVGTAEPTSLAVWSVWSVWSVMAGERQAIVEIESTGPGAGRLRAEGRIHAFRVCRRGTSVEIWIRGRRFVFEIVDRNAHRATGDGGGRAASELVAPMPGRVLQVNAVVGQEFDAHAPLILMESMKMEMTISAPAAGRVSEVLCAEGDLVEMGETLARLEPAEREEETVVPTSQSSPEDR